MVIKRYFGKMILLATAVIGVMEISSIGANAAWIKDDTGWWYTEGTAWSTGWREIDGKWYYFNDDGYMAHDVTINGYVLGTDGAWQQNQSIDEKSSLNEDFEFDKSTGTITKHTGGKSEVVIPNKINNIQVKTIGAFAFEGCNALKSVTISNGVMNIGLYAFKECLNLENIKISSSVTSIGKDSFWGDSKLSEIQVDDGNNNFLSINGVLFNKQKTKLLKYPEGKKYVTSYVIPETVNEIESGAFNCSNIEHIEIGRNVTKIKEGTFRGSKIKSIKLPDNLESIEQYAFYCCHELAEINIPDTVTSIKNDAFHSCEELKYIKIPNGVTTIEKSTFYECYSLVGVEIPNSVTTIEDKAFAECKNLNNSRIPDSVKNIGIYAFAKVDPDNIVCV